MAFQTFVLYPPLLYVLVALCLKYFYIGIYVLYDQEGLVYIYVKLLFLEAK